eukprot:scaffold34647_cov182-Amphora_coffeaeformis.AAC.1
MKNPPPPRTTTSTKSTGGGQPVGESNNKLLRQDWESISAANKQRNEYRKKLDLLLDIIRQAKLWSSSTKKEAERSPSEQEQHDKCVLRLYEHLAEVNIHTRALIPLTKEEELAMGYTKKHMVTIFLRQDFDEYDRLSVFAEILKHFTDEEESESLLANNELLMMEMNTYVENFGMLYDLVTEETEASPITSDRLTMEALAAIECKKKDSKLDKRQDDQRDGLLMESNETQDGFGNRSSSSPVKRAVSVLSMVRSATGKAKARRRIVRSPVVPDTITELHHDATKVEAQITRETPLNDMAAPASNSSRIRNITESGEMVPLPSNGSLPTLNHPLSRDVTIPVANTSKTGSLLARFSGKSNTAERAAKRLARSPSPPKRPDPSSRSPTTPIRTNMCGAVPFVSDTSEVLAETDLFGFSTANQAEKDVPMLSQSSLTGNDTGATPKGTETLHHILDQSSSTPSPIPWDERASPVTEGVSLIPSFEKMTEANKEAKPSDPLPSRSLVDVMGEGADYVNTDTQTTPRSDIPSKTAEIPPEITEAEPMTKESSVLGFSLFQSIASLWKTEPSDDERSKMDYDEESYEEPSLIKTVFRSSAIPVKMKKSKQSTQHQIQSHMETLSTKTDNFESPYLDQVHTSSAKKNASGPWSTKEASQQATRDVERAPNRVMMVLARSTPSGISSVSSHDTSEPTRSSASHGEPMDAIWENAVPAHSVSGVEEEPTEVVFWDENEDVDPGTKRNAFGNRWRNFVTQWRSDKQEKHTPKVGIFTEKLAQIWNRRVDENERGDIKSEIQPQTTSLLFMVIFAQLIMDFLINLISFRHISQESSCCGVEVVTSKTVWAVTLFFFITVILEMIVLLYSVWQSRRTNKKKTPSSTIEENMDSFHDELDTKGKWNSIARDILLWALCLNPFLACLLTWALMYEVEERSTAVSILYLEVVSIALVYATLYLEWNKLSFLSLTAHAIPIVPFFITCFIVWYYLARGGVCYYADEGRFWFDGCELCADGWPPDSNGLCPGGDSPENGGYCGTEIDEEDSLKTDDLHFDLFSRAEVIYLENSIISPRVYELLRQRSG